MPQDIFHPLSKIEREEKLAALGEFVKHRDGIPDFSKRTLSHREKGLRRFDNTPVLYRGVVDRALFEAQYRHFDQRSSTPRELLLLLTFVKFNNTEAFAVERSFDAVTRGIVRPNNDIELVLLLEEHYHTKILLTAAKLFGIDITPRIEASPAVALLNTATLRLPDALRYPLLLDAELLGVMMLTHMLRLLREVFEAAPSLRDALEERLIDVLIDEIGHVSYNRLQLNAYGCALAKALLPLVAWGIGCPVAEARALGLFPIPLRDVFAFEMKQLPDAIRRSAFIA
ncbi:MAG: hypothetical protein ACREX9_01060 [Gammaproteobacteria bacterium]